MSEMLRKDYGSDAIVDYSNETVKRVFFQNTPFSVEATGHDKRPEKMIVVNSANLDTIIPTTRVSYGNKQGIVTSVVLTDNGGVFEAPLVSLSISFVLADGETVVETYTKAELLLITNLFFYSAGVDSDTITFSSQGADFTGISRLLAINEINDLDGTAELGQDATKADIKEYIDGLDEVSDADLIADIIAALGGVIPE